MKYFALFIALLALVMPLTAEEPSKIIIMKGFDRSYEGYSFNAGELVKLDLSEDMPSGLGMNNAELTDWFPGKAGIIDLGPVSLEIDTEIPSEGFSPFLGPESIIPGHSYIVVTADSEHFGKIQIVQFDIENEVLEFTWVYLVE